MIYSGSGSSFAFSELRIQIRIQPLLVPVLFKYIQSIRRIYQLVAIFYFVLQSYSTHSPEFTGDRLKMRNEIVIYLFICTLIFCWIRIRNNNFGSGSRQKCRIHADPDPQHWVNQFRLSSVNKKVIYYRVTVCCDFTFTSLMFAQKWGFCLINDF